MVSFSETNDIGGVNIMEMLWIGALAAFVIAAVCGVFAIPILHRLKFGQEIREEGPKWHAAKSGTPTMGGFIFIIAMFLAAGICAIAERLGGRTLFATSQLAMLLSISAAYAVIGFIDDYIKVILKRNLGLTALQKFGLQFLVALGFVCWAVFSHSVGTDIQIPFTNIFVDMRLGYIPFAVIVILASVNSVNLTDGLDGLASTVTAVVAIFYMLVSQFGRVNNPAVAFFAAIMLGGLLGFLIYNRYPAKVFMGDTGSLFLGGAVCGMAILLKQPLTLLIVGFVYVMESLSVILQVTSYKLTGKRIFKMSPIHHHFEMCGWSEKKIVAVFSLITVLLCALMYFAG